MNDFLLYIAPGIVAVLLAGAAYIRAKAANSKVDNHTDNHPGGPAS